MTTPVSTLVVTPSAAANAYNKVGSGALEGGSGDFSAMLQRTLQGAVDAGHAAETKATEAIAGNGNLTDVVTALAHAELTLQTATTVRDRVVQAYQDIIKMPI
jgi:flagellar hook-basal body complex protein FliE